MLNETVDLLNSTKNDLAGRLSFHLNLFKADQDPSHHYKRFCTMGQQSKLLFQPKK